MPTPHSAAVRTGRLPHPTLIACAGYFKRCLRANAITRCRHSPGSRGAPGRRPMTTAGIRGDRPRGAGCLLRRGGNSADAPVPDEQETCRGAHPSRTARATVPIGVLARRARTTGRRAADSWGCRGWPSRASAGGNILSITTRTGPASSRHPTSASGARFGRTWMPESVTPGFDHGVLSSVMAWVPMTPRSLSRSAASLPGAAVWATIRRSLPGAMSTSQSTVNVPMSG